MVEDKIKGVLNESKDSKIKLPDKDDANYELKTKLLLNTLEVKEKKNIRNKFSSSMFSTISRDKRE
jgi:hypothetical protein